MLAELSQGRSCGRAARGGRASVCRVEFSYPVPPAVVTDLYVDQTPVAPGPARKVRDGLVHTIYTHIRS